MKFPFSNITHLWSWLIIEELLRNGIDYFCLSPGSRSTPLTTAVARHQKAKHIVIYDERAAAYHALGYARAANKPAVLICTSGTAAANYFPAVIEAAQEHIPLIVLSADRPPELRDSGANQTIDQVKMYGSYVRWQMDLAAPDEQIPAAYVLSTVDRLLQKTMGANGGPVHLNCMFREPLTPVEQTVSESYRQKIARWIHSSRPWTKSSMSETLIHKEGIEKIARGLSQTKKGLVLLGRLPQNKNFKALQEFLNKLGWPVFPDVSSGLRLGGNLPAVIPYFDLMAQNLIDPFDTVLHFGGRFVSKRLQQFLQQHPPREYIHICADDRRLDEARLVTQRVLVSPEAFCRALADVQAEQTAKQNAAVLRQQTQAVHEALNERLPDDGALTQPLLSRLISREIRKNSGLFLANSLPVREMNMFAVGDGAPVAVAVNRGASGIDGTLASAAGFAEGLNQAVTLLIGDLALLHDLNSLMLVKRIGQPLILVVVNNGGGGIFHFLPIAEFDDVFEEYFATPHQLTFEAGAKLFGLPYRQGKEARQFVDVYRQAQTAGQSMLIEVLTDRRENVKLHRDIVREVTEVVNEGARAEGRDRSIKD